MKKNLKNTTDEKKKGKKRYRFRIRRIRKLLTFILIVAAVIIFARSSFFIVNKINVSGNKKYQANEIILRAGLVTGQNVFKMLGEKPKNLLTFRFNDKERNISESMPYIKSVSVRPALPQAISIKIQERSPFCILETKGTSLLIDREGYVLEDVKSNEQKNKYFKIIGISLDSYKLGSEVNFKSKDSLNNLITFCDAISKNDKDNKLKLYEKISSVDLSEENSITAMFDKRITVKFGDLEDLEKVDYKIRFFRQLFVNNITAKQKGTLDFTKNDNPYFIPKD